MLQQCCHFFLSNPCKCLYFVKTFYGLLDLLLICLYVVLYAKGSPFLCCSVHVAALPELLAGTLVPFLRWIIVVFTASWNAIMWRTTGDTPWRFTLRSVFTANSRSEKVASVKFASRPPVCAVWWETWKQEANFSPHQDGGSPSIGILEIMDIAEIWMSCHHEKISRSSFCSAISI
jgi:hypothetical protein